MREFGYDLIHHILECEIRGEGFEDFPEIHHYGHSDAEHDAHVEIQWAYLVHTREGLYEAYFEEHGVTLEVFQEVKNGTEATVDMFLRVLERGAE